MAVPVEIVDRLNELARQYRGQFLQSARSVLAQDKFRASGKTQDSLKAHIIQGTPEKAPQIVMEFDEAGEFISKRRLIFTKPPPASEILDTIKSGKFRIKSVPGYEGAAATLSLEKQQKRVAFAIAQNKFREQTHKRKNWRKPALSALLRQMNEALVKAWAHETETLLAQSLSTKK